jgi:glycosyltransferase involved in cell wall biosynthesis
MMGDGNIYSVGILQEAPTQFDEPVYALAARTQDIRLTVYYYGANAGAPIIDSEIGRKVGWWGGGAHPYHAVFKAGQSPFRFLSNIFEMRHDLVIVSGYNKPITAMAAVMGRMMHTPVGLRSDNVLPSLHAPGRYWAIKRILYPVWFRMYATGHPAGVGAARYLERFGFPEERLFRFPYCMDAEHFAQAAEKARSTRNELRAKRGLSPMAQVVCGVIKFSPREDPLTLVRAVREARQRLPNLVLFLVGDGPLRVDVEREAGKMSGGPVILPGYLPYATLPEIYALSDIFVHPASGPWEVSVAEALACGIPAIAADTVGSANDLILPKGLGCVFPRGDWHALSEIICKVIPDTGLMKRCRDEGPQVVESISPTNAITQWKRAIDYVRRLRAQNEYKARAGL